MSTILLYIKNEQEAKIKNLTTNAPNIHIKEYI